MHGHPEYKEVALFMLQMLSLLGNTAEVERTFSKLYANKTKLRSSLAIHILEVIMKTAESFPHNVDINTKLAHLYNNAKKNYMEKYSDIQVSHTEDFE